MVKVVDRGEAAEIVESSLVKSDVGGAACSSHREVDLHVSCHVFVRGVEGGLTTGVKFWLGERLSESRRCR